MRTRLARAAALLALLAFQAPSSGTSVWQQNDTGSRLVFGQAVPGTLQRTERGGVRLTVVLDPACAIASQRADGLRLRAGLAGGVGAYAGWTPEEPVLEPVAALIGIGGPTAAPAPDLNRDIVRDAGDVVAAVRSASAAREAARLTASTSTHKH